MSQLVLHEPVIDGGLVYCDYTYGDQQFRHRFSPGMPLPANDPKLRRMLRWLSAVHALYLCDFEYFTDMHAEYPLDDTERQFFEKLAYNGMAEFRLVNNIPMATRTSYTTDQANTEQADTAGSKPGSGILLLNGGGKDGCVSAVLLEEAGLPYTWFMQNSSVAQDQVATASGRPYLKTKRLMDQRRPSGKYHGHQPTSAALAVSATITAYLEGLAYVVTSNEHSANEGNGLIDGVAVNHQYSKSLEFERDFSALLGKYNIGVTYFSLLRPLHELQIVRIAASAPRYLNSFTSCNHGYHRGTWCMNCAKCAFVVLMFTTVSPAATAQIWGDELVINRPELFVHLQELLDPSLQKPLECVGTLEECQLAAGLVMEGSIAAQLSPAVVALFDQYKIVTSGPIAEPLLHEVSSDHMIPDAFTAVLTLLQRHLV